ncbi:hypothetical protein [Nocardia carnea]|uniref:hypothetical protein n=1 Tax=Nocardia carnea TaxID=37328 RepID=UPI002454745B|nr:hypothetical protein [Nocardia carnea]
MDGGMDPGQDQATAREQLLRYLLRTLQILPAESALSLVHPAIPQARLHRGVTLPAGDNEPQVVAEFFDIAYWIIGITVDAGGGCFDRIVRCWSDAGWPTGSDRDIPPRSAYTRTPDGFGLSVRQSVDGFVSLSGSTPPFPLGGTGTTPFPEFIRHPTPAGTGSENTDPRSVEHPDGGVRKS